METITKAVHDAVSAITGQDSNAQLVKKGDWVLLTGASGFVAAHCLTALLDAGYKVKCSVRSQEKADEIRKRRASHADKLDFVIVKDIVEPGAHDEAVKGVTAVVHTASPFTLDDKEDNRKYLLDPAIKGTVGVLESIVAHNPSIKRVVVTSSFAAMIDLSKGLRPGYTYSEADWNPITYDEAVKVKNGAAAYCASKKLAEKAAWDFVEERKPNFTVATICPPMVYGPLEHSARLDALNTSTADVYRLINGSCKTVPETSFYAWVDVRDVGVAHAAALNAPSDRYFITAGNFTYTQMCEIIARHFPQLVNSGMTPNPAGAPPPPEHYRVDNSRSRRVLGMSYRTLESCMIDLVNSLLKLKATEEGTHYEAAPVSVTDVRTGDEHRSHALPGTGLTGMGSAPKEWKETENLCDCKEGECKAGESSRKKCQGHMEGHSAPIVLNK
ncbi:Similar to Putative uncharacterized oxidoreductase C513.07; acc. no. Q9UT59 [Pyronema omphalodes CBS 100304]|uniref:Similar to Putative uncharacterized oxidoreductase C513.07 acc. no. Q9UT59 n=1 Tax=Pyronema omphalodes (strain CBS 100304) TaxID=1076935 RepID=U4L2I8_PYROM|nr:Similar to Putative uncharacterized oxidoreductase C513.07; acc. no. Q9UT59 [Pyronema omphalodes CBS 100304]